MDTLINESDNDSSPMEIIETAKQDNLNLLPPKSKERYEVAYNQFMNWRKTNEIKDSISENDVLAYFTELAEKIAPTSLWTQYSMLRSTLVFHDNIDISKYLELRSLLKLKSDGYTPQKSNNLSSEEINKFLIEAPDDRFLLIKVILIIGASGGCRKHELMNLTIDDVQDLGSAVIIKIPDSKTNLHRTFCITDEAYHIYKKYAALRPPEIKIRRFFLLYRNNKCTLQPLGLSQIASAPKLVAKFLNLKDPESYTSLSFRKISGDLLINSGGGSTAMNHQKTLPETTSQEIQNVEDGSHESLMQLGASSLLINCKEENIRSDAEAQKLEQDKNSELKINQKQSDSQLEKPELVDEHNTRDPMDSKDISTDDPPTSPAVIEPMKETNFALLPPKTQEKYETSYNQFMDWRKLNNIKSSFSEKVLLKYFTEIGKKMAPSSLWNQYSKLRCTLCHHKNIDIADYLKLRAFLKEKSVGYTPQKSKILSLEDITRFLSEAPDDQYLLFKVILIIGISGGCTKQELINLNTEDIQDLGSAAIIKLPDSKTKNRTFGITGEAYHIYKKYANYRPSGMIHRRFFLNYQKQQCTRQSIGINQIGIAVRKVAQFLRLENPELYTGHCFKRLSGVILGDATAESSSKQPKYCYPAQKPFVDILIQNKSGESNSEKNEPSLVSTNDKGENEEIDNEEPPLDVLPPRTLRSQQPSTNVQNVFGRRIVDINFILTKIFELEKSHGKECSFCQLQVKEENRKGFFSEFIIRCSYCNKIFKITSEDETITKRDPVPKVNYLAVQATLDTGNTFAQLENFSMKLNIPPITSNVFSRIKRKIETGNKSRKKKHLECTSSNSSSPFTTVYVDELDAVPLDNIKEEPNDIDIDRLKTNDDEFREGMIDIVKEELTEYA